MFITYPDDANPFAIADGALQAKFFASRFQASNDYEEKLCILSDAMGNIHGYEHRDKFCELINIPPRSALVETMCAVGDGLAHFDHPDATPSFRALITILMGVPDNAEFDIVEEAAEHLDAGAIEPAMQLLTELRQKRSTIVTNNASAEE